MPPVLEDAERLIAAWNERQAMRAADDRYVAKQKSVSET